MKRTKKIAMAASLALAAAVAISVPASAQALVCGQTVYKDVTLTEDLDCSAGGTNGLEVGKFGITIDLGGHSIIGAGGADGFEGIESDGRNQVTIRNGSIKLFKDGIFLQNASNHLIEDVHLVTDDPGNYDGIHSTYGTGNTFSHVGVVNALHGIFLASGSGNVVEDSRLRYPTEGVHTENESSDLIRRNKTNGLTVTTYAIHSDHDFGLRIRRNSSERGYIGTYLNSPTGVIVNGDQSTGNGKAGIFIEGNAPESGFWAKVINSTAIANDEYGMYAQYGVESAGNTAVKNGYYNCYLVSCNN
jgi:hypothetical protein